MRYDYDRLLDRMHELEQFAMLKDYKNPKQRAAIAAKEEAERKKRKKRKEAEERKSKGEDSADQDGEESKEEDENSDRKSKSPKNKLPNMRKQISLPEKQRDREKINKLGKHSQGNDLAEKPVHAKTRDKSEKMHDKSLHTSVTFSVGHRRPAEPRAEARTKFDDIDETI